MKGLKTLIKLHRRNLDEKRRDLVVLEEGKYKLMEVQVKLQQELKDEQKLAAQSGDVISMYAPYAKRMLKKQKMLTLAIMDHERKIETLTETITNLFGELKKFEILKTKQDAEEALKEKHREQVELDDIGGLGHQRKIKAAQTN